MTAPRDDRWAEDTLLVFSDDWGRHPSSCQHLVSRLLDRHRVVWVNTIGLRPPSLNRATFNRGFEKFRQWMSGAGRSEPRSENPHVLNPRMWPWFTRRHDRNLNRRLLKRALVRVIEAQPTPVTAITTIPIVADLIGELPVDRWVYYCVDDFSVWPGLDQAALRDMESKLIAQADRIIAVSDTLRNHIAAAGRDAELLTHGVDLDFWRQPATVALPEAVRSAEPPFVVFWGVVDRRMDTAFVRQLSADLSRGTILLVGPEQNADPQMSSLPRVRRIPQVPLAALPSLAAVADVLIMPYVDADVTRAMQPLKLKEYLATDRPVVVRDLPATRDWDDCLDLAETAGQFSDLVRRRLETGLPDDHRDARRRLEHESWDRKARVFEQIATFTRLPEEAMA
jgi:glycosyltransferase involved in cell wall biosynthesis